MTENTPIAHPKRRRCAAAVLALALLAPAVAMAGGRPVLPGIGAHDPRVRMDPAAPPWRAVGKLQAIAGGLRSTCTATLVAPATVLTAAHCLWNRAAGRYFPPQALHFLLGYQSGRYAAVSGIARLSPSPDYDPAQPRATAGSDWALLTLEKRIGTPDRILPIRAALPEPGDAVMIGGYSQDHALLLTADPACKVTGRAVDGTGRALLTHDCTGTHGVSGAPVLMREGGVWRIAGIDVAAAPGAARGLAVVLDAVRGVAPRAEFQPCAGSKRPRMETDSSCAR